MHDWRPGQQLLKLVHPAVKGPGREDACHQGGWRPGKAGTTKKGGGGDLARVRNLVARVRPSTVGSSGTVRGASGLITCPTSPTLKTYTLSQYVAKGHDSFN